MSHEPPKSNFVLIAIATIGVIGTIVASAIGALTSYNIERQRQDFELTKIALVSIATQGGATQVVLERTINAPTQPPPFTTTPYPTYTQPVVPTEVIPTSTTITKLFADNFDSGISPIWSYMDGTNYGMTNGQLSSIGLFTAYVGDNNWTNYVVEFDLEYLLYSGFNFNIMIRRQNDSDYMAFQLNTFNRCSMKWVKVINGIETEIVNSETRISGSYSDCPGKYKIEITGNTYKTIRNSQLLLTFTDNTYSSGGVGILSTTPDERFKFIVDNFQIISLP